MCDVCSMTCTEGIKTWLLSERFQAFSVLKLAFELKYELGLTGDHICVFFSFLFKVHITTIFVATIFILMLLVILFAVLRYKNRR